MNPPDDAACCAACCAVSLSARDWSASAWAAESAFAEEAWLSAISDLAFAAAAWASEASIRDLDASGAFERVAGFDVEEDAVAIHVFDRGTGHSVILVNRARSLGDKFVGSVVTHEAVHAAREREIAVRLAIGARQRHTGS
jgi:hypothetical protein